MALTPDHPLRDRIVQQLRAWYWLLQTGRAGKESWRLTQTLAQLIQVEIAGSILSMVG